VFADRAEYLGDPDFQDVPVQALLSDGYLDRRAAEVDHDAISSLRSVLPGLEHHDTTHFSIVDRWGNAVANTYTLNTSFGSGVVVEGGGFLLNNEMDDFAVKPGEPNYYGVVGAAANAIAPGKRMLSSMTPTILLKDGEVSMVLGSPGGSTIITSVYQVIVNVVAFGMSAEQAVGACRFHHQLLPPELVTYSPSVPLPAATLAGLERLGYRVEPHDWELGDIQLVLRGPRGWEAASDPRGRGQSRVLH
jgi:gamma-glutamyltranspeptidase/glutathione hydrolase